MFFRVIFTAFSTAARFLFTGMLSVITISSPMLLPSHMPQQMSQHLRIKCFGCLLLRADSAFFNNQGINPKAGKMVLKDTENPPPDVPVVFFAVKKDEIQAVFNQVELVAVKGLKGGEGPPGRRRLSEILSRTGRSPDCPLHPKRCTDSHS
jgi:hypothetical protein